MAPKLMYTLRIYRDWDLTILEPTPEAVMAKAYKKYEENDAAPTGLDPFSWWKKVSTQQFDTFSIDHICISPVVDKNVKVPPNPDRIMDRD